MTVFSELLNSYLEKDCSPEWLNVHKLRLRNRDASDIESAKRDQLISLYKGMTGCDYNIFPGGPDFQASDLLIMLLIHFRYMNAEQVNMLFPLYSGNLLKAYKGRLKSGSPYFNSVAYNGKSCVYTLTQDVYDLYLSYFPSEYIERTGIMPFSKTTRKSTLAHDVSMCDIPYGCLSRGFAEPMRWFCYCPLRTGKSPADSVRWFLEREQNGAPYLQSDDIVPDAIMLFENTGVLAEQDMCTERINQIVRKFTAYGDYLSSFGDTYETVQLLFNVSLPGMASGTRSTGRGIVKNLFLFSDILDNRNLQFIYDKLTNMENKDRKSYHNMIELIEEFAPTEHERFRRSLEELEEYVSGKNSEIEKTDREHYQKKLNARVGDIRNAFRKFLDGDTPAAGAFLKAMRKGLSFIATCDFRMYCRYFELSESGMADTFLEKIRQQFARTSLAPYVMKGVKLVAGQLEYVFRNCVLFRQPDKKNYPLIYIIEEISFDIAGRYRMSDFLRAYGRNDINNHCLLLVRDEKDAIEFCKETDCIGKFCIEEQVFTANPAFNLTIRFYSMNTDRYFIMNSTEHIYYVEEI